jgi:hypothetical protein
MKKKVEIFAYGKVNVKIIKSKEYGKEYRQRWAYFPAELIESGKFPFEDNEKIVFRIDEKNSQVIIQKATLPPLTR